MRRRLLRVRSEHLRLTRIARSRRTGDRAAYRPHLPGGRTRHPPSRLDRDECCCSRATSGRGFPTEDVLALFDMLWALRGRMRPRVGYRAYTRDGQSSDLIEAGVKRACTSRRSALWGPSVWGGACARSLRHRDARRALVRRAELRSP